MTISTSLLGGAAPNTVLETGYDLRVFFAVVGLAPDKVTSREVLASMTEQRAGRPSMDKTGKAPLVALSAG